MVAGHLPGQAAEGEGPAEALAFQQSGLLLPLRHSHREARPPQLLLGAEIVHEAREEQLALPAQAIKIAAAAAPEGDRHGQRSGLEPSVLLGDIDILHPGELFQSGLGKGGAVAPLCLPQCHDCRLFRRLHQTIHR